MIIDYYQGDEIYYPSSDNEPMGENDVICWLMTASLDMLKRHFQDQPQVYVSSNSFVYYVKGDVEQRVAPDLYVVKGVEAKQRPNYKVWEEGVVPQVVFEFTTESSRYKDLGTKKGLYEALGVKEYYLFDPASEYLTPHFRAKEEASQAKEEALQAKEEVKRERERAEKLQRELDALRG